MPLYLFSFFSSFSLLLPPPLASTPYIWVITNLQPRLTKISSGNSCSPSLYSPLLLFLFLCLSIFSLSLVLLLSFSFFHPSLPPPLYQPYIHPMPLYLFSLVLLLSFSFLHPHPYIGLISTLWISIFSISLVLLLLLFLTLTYVLLDNLLSLLFNNAKYSTKHFEK